MDKQNTYIQIQTSIFRSVFILGLLVFSVIGVHAQPLFTKNFSGSTFPGGVVTLTFTIDNSASGVAATSIAFTDDLPAGVTVANPANGSTICTSGTLTAVAGTGTISYTGGSVAAGTSCTITVDVTASTTGMYINTTSDLTSSAGNSGTASATLTVADPELDITLEDSISYDPSMDMIANPNDSIKYTLNIENTGDTSVYDIDIDRGSDPNITLDPSTIKATPVAINDEYELMGSPFNIPMGMGLLTNDADVNDPLPNPPFNTNLTVLSAQGASPGTPQATANDGTVTVNVDGSFVYDSTGVATAIADSFFYKIIDSEGFQDSARVIVFWTRPPVAQDDALTATVTIMNNYGAGTLFNDNGNGEDDLGIPAGNVVSFGGGDAGGTVTTNMAGSMVAFAGGMLTVNSDGSFTVDNATMSGIFTFDYRIENAYGVSDATVTLTIIEPPAAQPDSSTFLFSVDQNVSAGAGLFVDNGSGADDLGFPDATLISFGGGSLGGSVIDHSAGTSALLAGGNLKVNADGSWTLMGQPFTPGNYTFEYRIQNTAGFSDATVTLVIQDPPVAQPDSLSAVLNMVNNYPAPTLFDDNGSGPDHLGTPAAALTFFGGGDAPGMVTTNAAGNTVGFAGGMLTVNGDGSLVVSNPTMSGNFTFDYRIQNAAGFSDTTVMVTIQGPPDGKDDSDATVLAGTSTPGSTDFHIAINTSSTGVINVYVDNGNGADILGLPEAPTDPPADVIDNVMLAGTADAGTGSIGSGSFTIGSTGNIEITTAGDLNLTPPTGFVGLIEFDYTLANSIGTDATPATVTVAVGNRPVAMADAYSATGNIPINTTTVSGNDLLANDTGDSIAVTTVQGNAMNVGVATATANGGSVVVQTNGEFEYTPPTGYTGNDTYTYTVGNGFGNSSSVTVTITISDLIYFMDDAAAAGGDGSLAKPYQTIEEHNAAPPTSNSYLFIEDNGNTYSGNLTLVSGQTVIGEGTVGTLFGMGSLTGITLATLSDTIPYSTTGMTTDWAQIINNSGGAVTFNSGNTITGLSIGNRMTYAFTDNGSSVGMLSLKESEVTGTGGGVKIENGGTLDIALASLTTSGGAYGLWLKGTSGTMTVSGGTITNPTTSAITVEGGSVSATFTSSSISQSVNTNTVSVTGGHSGILTYSGTVNTTNGNGLQFNNADGQYNFNNTVTLNGGDAGIDILSGSGASFTFSNTTITNPSGTAFNINNSSANISYLGGSITQNTAASGVVVNTNTSIVRLTAELNLNTATNPAINVSGGGSIQITNANNTVSTTSATAVTINGTTIAAAGVTLKSVSSNGATRAIYLSNAGPASGGFFTVTGTGSTDGTGGTIQNITNRGVEIVNTDKVTLKNMNFTNVGTVNGSGTCNGLDNIGCNAAIYGSLSDDIALDNLFLNGGEQIGINGKNINNWSLTNSTVQGFGNEVNEHGIYIRELTGNATIDTSTVKTSSERNVLIETSSGSMNFVSNGSTYSESSLTLGADGMEFGIDGTATAAIDIDDCDFLKNRTNGLQVLVEGSASVTQCDVTNSTFDPMGGPGIGMDLASASTGQLRFNVIGNPKIYGNGGSAVNIFSTDNGTVEGRINNNPDIQVGGTGTGGSGVVVTVNNQARGIVEINNNTVGNIGNDIGISVAARLRSTGMGACSTGCTNGRLDATITNNTVTVVDPILSLYDIEVRAQEENTTCAYVANNTASNVGIAAFRSRTNDANATMLLQGFNTSATMTWAGNGNTPTTAGAVSESHFVGTLAGGTCTTPSNPMP